MSYVYPCETTSVSDSFQDHVDRRSVNPGTDYTAAYGDEVCSVADGIVTDADVNPDGSGGRTIHVDHDDGSGADYLHLSALAIRAGQRVRQGQLIGWSGGSGEGENRYNPANGKGYWPHLHISFRRNHSHGYGNSGNLDFDALMRTQISAAGGGARPIQEDDMYTTEDRERDDLTAKQTRSIITSDVMQASFRAAITDIYKVRLGRAPDPAGLATYLDAMTNKGQTRADIDAAVQASAEYKKRHP